MAFAAIAAEGGQDILARPGGKPTSIKGLLSFGDTSPGAKYGAFRPGGRFAPIPSFKQITGAAHGRDVGQVAANVFLPGLGPSIFGGAGTGRGALRRQAARKEFKADPGLVAIQSAVRASGASTAEGIAAVVADLVQRDPNAAASLANVLGQGEAAGGFTKRFGERANQLGDILKATFGLGTVRKKGSAGATDVLAALLGAGVSPPTNNDQPSASPSRAAPSTSELTAGAPRVSVGSAFAEERPVGIVDDWVGPILSGVGTALSARMGATASPSGSVMTPAGMALRLPSVTRAAFPDVYDPDAGVLQGAEDYATDVVSGTTGGAALMRNLMSPYRRTRAGNAVAKPFVLANPVTGALEWFGKYGRPKGWTAVTVKKRRCHSGMSYRRRSRRKGR